VNFSRGNGSWFGERIASTVQTHNHSLVVVAHRRGKKLERKKKLGRRIKRAAGLASRPVQRGHKARWAQKHAARVGKDTGSVARFALLSVSVLLCSRLASGLLRAVTRLGRPFSPRHCSGGRPFTGLPATYLSSECLPDDVRLVSEEVVEDGKAGSGIKVRKAHFFLGGGETRKMGERVGRDFIEPLFDLLAF
jgi:hypothetical protein